VPNTVLCVALICLMSNQASILAIARSVHPCCEQIMQPENAPIQPNRSRLRLNRMMFGIALLGVAIAYLPPVLSLPFAVVIVAVLVGQGRRLPAVPVTYKPPHVQAAIIISFLLGLYAAMFSVPLCLIGSFVGPEILITGLMHAVLSTVLLLVAAGSCIDNVGRDRSSCSCRDLSYSPSRV
jgi:hypothetical protein